jgi:hypothetical protein
MLHICCPSQHNSYQQLPPYLHSCCCCRAHDVCAEAEQSHQQRCGGHPCHDALPLSSTRHERDAAAVEGCSHTHTRGHLLTKDL